MPKFILLWTDAALFALVLAVIGYAWHVARSRTLRATWGVLLATPLQCVQPLF